MLAKTLDGNALLRNGCVVKAFEVYNPVLANNFAAQRSILDHRIKSDPTVFNKSDWHANRPELRGSVKKHFDDVAGKSPWNQQGLHTPIFPVVHGTNTNLAWKITETGFASLASLDAGWYGAGMYFTTSAMYAAPYYLNSTNPAILICLVNTGNPFPVIESRNDQDSLWGLPIKSGYQSNYVVTGRDGQIHVNRSEPAYNEIVIPQESQVMPIYLLELKLDATMRVATEFQRVVSGKFIEAKKAGNQADSVSPPS